MEIEIINQQDKREFSLEGQEILKKVAQQAPRRNGKQRSSRNSFSGDAERRLRTERESRYLDCA